MRGTALTDSTPSSAPAGWFPAGVEGQERYWDGTAWTDQVRPVGGTVAPTPAQSIPAAWYPDTNAPGTERYYDGTAWTAQTRPQAAVEAAPAPVVADPTVKRPWYKRKAIVIPVGVLAGIIVISGIGNTIAGGRGDDSAAPQPPASSSREEEPAAAVDVEVPDTTGLTAKEAQALIENAGLEVEFSAEEGVVLDRDNWTVLNTTPAAGETAQEGDTVVVNVEKIVTPEEQAAADAEKALAAMTVAQQGAIRSAESYLSFSGFSRAGLTQQLTSEYGEGYEAADAEIAIAYLEKTGGVNWNDEAVESAESYLEMTGFSRQGLYDQLTSSYGEGFTPEQANYALDQVGL